MQATVIPFYSPAMRDEIRPLSYQNHFLQACAFTAIDAFKPRFVVYYSDLQLISHRTYFLTTWLYQALGRRGIRLEPHWILHSERHFFTRTPGRALRQQFNIGISIEDDPAEDFIRGGLGVVFHEKDAVPNGPGLGMRDWGDLWVAIDQDHGRFDRLFTQHLGGLGYAEAAQWQRMPVLPVTAQRILAYQPNPRDDWLFIGRQFRRSDPHDAAILGNRDLFAQACLDIFRRIRAAGYAPGL